MKPFIPARSALVAAAATGALLGGCGGADKVPGASEADPSASPAAVAPNTVGMKNLRFAPDRLTVAVGETVTWRNDESLDHNVVARTGASFRSRAFGRGGTYTFTPEAPGTIDYVCTLHPGMDGRIVVTR